ncbi:14685_t:CDS:2 [Dentiscutata erythropus]|uniref:14685_t:CDS:1 n=1 Tax=Dentiscutata erythropus TaxID=1348616 RepID=A0A9N9D0P0_9GLOM|nr:14685_t:CDS:2 [Dentiscutata erythropus]
MNDKTEKEVAREIHSTLYSKKKNAQKHVIERYFDVNAVFEDPIVSIQGHDKIIRQFILLSTMFLNITPEIHTITDTEVAGNHHIVSIDAFIKYRLPLKLLLIRNEIELRTITRFEFNEQQKIVKHEDIWSLKDLLENLPIIGCVYSGIGRRFTGIVTNQLVILVQETIKVWKHES